MPNCRRGIRSIPSESKEEAERRSEGRRTASALRSDGSSGSNAIRGEQTSAAKSCLPTCAIPRLRPILTGTVLTIDAGNPA